MTCVSNVRVRDLTWVSNTWVKDLTCVNLRGQKSLGPLKMSLEMAQKVIVPQKKIYVPQFLKQRVINSYSVCRMS
jgi:hypothetical protein